jgi:hypothetical protein
VSVTLEPLAAGTPTAVLSIGTTAGNVGVSLSATSEDRA